MERLTTEYCGNYVPRELCSIDRLGGADDCQLCCEYCKATEDGNDDCRECAINKCFNKLGEYENLEEQGKLPKLPCAVGKLTYWAHEYLGRVRCTVVEKIIIDEDGSWVVTSLATHKFDDFGKTVFLTEEEAEAALKELQQ